MDKYFVLYQSVSILEAVKLFVAEFFGTAILVLVGCLSCVDHIGGGVLPLMHKGLFFGLAVMAAVQVFGAHINPSISFAAVMYGKLALNLLPLYLVAQVLGGIVGFGFLKSVMPQIYVKNELDTIGVCSAFIHPEISVAQGFLVEILCTWILVWFACGVWDPRNANTGDSVPAKFGFVVAALVAAFGSLTGTQMNPARSLGPAVFNNDWDNHWVFWIAPILAGILASSFYRFLFLFPEESKDETLPTQ